VTDTATLYAPLVRVVEGHAWVEFSDDHPGARDAEYRLRRAAIADAAVAYRPGDIPSDVTYNEAERVLWSSITRELRPRHAEHACAPFLAGRDAVALGTDAIPQLRAVSERLQSLTGFRLEPAPGLVPMRTFYGALGDRRFLATQFLRHPSRPTFAPEPDMLHELCGHANALGDSRLAGLYELAGKAALRITRPAAMRVLSQVFWFCLEYGMVLENGVPKTYGASLLSSPGELDQVHRVPMVPLDIARMATLGYDVTQYQPLLFLAASFSEAEDVFGTFFRDATVELPEVLGLDPDAFPVLDLRDAVTAPVSV
jgi:phenylalanine-4-hydroxylase